MKKPKFSKFVFVKREVDSSDGTDFLLADENQAGLVDGDGPTFVATYQFVKVNKLTKTIQFED